MFTLFALALIIFTSYTSLLSYVQRKCSSSTCHGCYNPLIIPIVSHLHTQRPYSPTSPLLHGPFILSVVSSPVGLYLALPPQIVLVSVPIGLPVQVSVRCKIRDPPLLPVDPQWLPQPGPLTTSEDHLISKPPTPPQPEPKTQKLSGINTLYCLQIYTQMNHDIVCDIPIINMN